jgi:hypothetical protein
MSSVRTRFGTVGPGLLVCRYPVGMEPAQEVEFVFEPQHEGGYHVYAPELPGLQTECSLWTRDPEAELLPLLRELGIGFLP